jgi:hypothetical protein
LKPFLDKSVPIDYFGIDGVENISRLAELVKVIMRFRMRDISVAAVVAIILLFPFILGADDGDLELSFDGGYFEPLADVEDFSGEYFYGLTVHYWMNDTSTFDVFANQANTLRELPIYDKDDKGRKLDEDEIRYETILVGAGFRYLPELDLFFTPSLGMGLGLNFWSIEAKEIDKKEDISVCYFASAGGEYSLTPRLRLALYTRFVHIPFKDHLEKELYFSEPDEYDRDYEDMETSQFLMFGVNLNYKVK